MTEPTEPVRAARGPSRRHILAGAGVLAPALAAASPSEARTLPRGTAETLLLSQPGAPAGGRSGLFVWDAGLPPSAHQLDAADADGIGEGVYIAPSATEPGAWRRLVSQSVDAGWFGLEAGTGKTPQIWDRNRRALQRAIDFALFSGTGVSVAIPAGQFEYSGTLHLGYGDTFRSLAVSGAGRSYGPTPGSGTTLYHKGSTAHQAMNWQGMRNPRLERLTLIGQLASYYGTLPPERWLEETNWLPPAALTPGRDDHGEGRFNPYAGLTVDAYSGPRPARAYPDVAHPAKTPQTQYNRRFSSQMTLHEVEIRGFNTGIAVQPCDADGNGDYLSLDRCAILACRYGVSIGNSQSRYVTIERTLFGPCHTALTNVVHGRQIGQFGGAISTCEFACCWLANFSMNYLAPVTFLNCGSEAIYGILKAHGQIGVVRFINPNFNFGQVHAFAVPAHVVTGQNTNVVFEGGAWRHAHPLGFESPMARIQGYPLAYWIETTADMPAWKVPFAQAFAGGFVPGRAGIDQRSQLVWRAITLSPDRSKVTVIGWSRSDEHLCQGAAPGRAALLPHGSPDYGATPHGIAGDKAPSRRPAWRHELPKARTRWTLADRTLTLEVPGLSDETAFWYGYLPGDMIRCLDSGTVFVVKARTGTTLLAQQQTNYWQRPGHPPVEPIPETGTWECVNNRLYGFPSGPATFTTTAGSPSVAVTGPFPTEVSPGDALLFPLYGEEFVLSGSFETRVVAVDAASRTITLNGPARRSGTSRHTFALSAPPPNG